MVITFMYEYLQIGRISNTHGVRGEVKVIPLTDDPERFNELEWVFIDKKRVWLTMSIVHVNAGCY